MPRETPSFVTQVDLFQTQRLFAQAVAKQNEEIAELRKALAEVAVRKNFIAGDEDVLPDVSGGTSGGADLSALRIKYDLSDHTLKWSIDNGATWTNVQDGDAVAHSAEP